MDKNPIHIINEEAVELLPEKAALLHAHDALLIADVHLGKVSHFRKAGMAVPLAAADKTLMLLETLFTKHPAKRVIFMGDLFHSELNAEWLAFKKMLAKFPKTGFELIGGNHDVLHPMSYTQAGITYHKKELLLGKLRLVHEPQKSNVNGYYDLCGHVHPGYRLSGRGRQALTLPCFYFGKSAGILPAFGSFTGLYPVQVEESDALYICIGENLVQRIDIKKTKKN